MPESIDNLNVWAACKIQIINEDTWKYQTLAEVPYTPKHIKQAMREHGLKAAWIWFLGDRTYQFIDDIRAG